MNYAIFLKTCRKIQSVITPRLRYSQYLYEDVIKEYAESDKTWLDLGCGHSLLPPWRLEEEKALVGVPRLLIGLDYDQQSLEKHETFRNKVRGDISRLPFTDDSRRIGTNHDCHRIENVPDIAGFALAVVHRR